MANAFTLFGELKADTRAFERSLLDANRLLIQTQGAIERTEQQSKEMGQTSATTARQFDKLKESVNQTRQRLTDAANAYQKGDISARRYATIVGQVDSKVSGLNSRLRDAKARMADFSAGANRMGQGLRDVFGGTLLAGGVAGMSMAIKDFAVDSVKLFGTLDKLTRFTATLDKSFQTPEALRKFREDIQQLSTQIPHSAESIAKASFTLKSAYQNMTEPELIEFLREFGNAATASNTDIATHAFNMAALAKQYKITREELPKFSALMTSAFGQALATDEKVSAGFNRILSAAQSTKQPLADLVAAMSTLQSVSSDAETNTTLLLNVYSKLTDPKYIEGMKEMGVSVFDTAGNFKGLNQLINEMAKELQGLSDKEVTEKLSWAKDLQAREGLKILIRQVQDYNKQLADGADEEAFKRKNELMLNSVEARWEKFSNKINNLKMATGAIIADLSEGRTSDIGKHGIAGGFTVPGNAIANTAKTHASTWSKALIQAIGTHSPEIGAAIGAVTRASSQKAGDEASAGGQSIGRNISAGMQAGIASGHSGVVGAAISLAQSAWQAAKDALQIQSPSKKFVAIGKDTAQGFIDGIESMKTGVFTAMARLLDVSNIKKLGKGDAPGVELLTRLIQELDQLTPRTRLEAAMAELTAEKYKKLNTEVRNRIVLAAKQLDIEEAREKRFARFAELVANEDRFLFPEMPAFEATGEGTGIFEAFEKELEAFEKEWDLVIEKMGTPPPIDLWGTFWGGMQHHLEKFKNTLPSMKEALGTNLISSIEGIGNVFASAVSYWDGTARGFFKNLASGFAQMAKQIIAELARIMVMKAVMQIIGAFAGGIGGSAGGAGSSAGSSISGAISGLASGGVVRGPGSSTSDSIMARLSNGEFVMSAKAVRKWGTGFMEQLNSGFSGLTPSFAGGGMVGGSTNNYSDNWAPTINVYVPAGNSNPSAVKVAAEQGARQALQVLDRQRRRSK